MLKTEAHGDKLNEFYHLPKKEATFFIMKKMDGEGIIKNEIVIYMFSVCVCVCFLTWFVFELKVPKMRITGMSVKSIACTVTLNFLSYTF